MNIDKKETYSVNDRRQFEFWQKNKKKSKLEFHFE